MDSVPSNAPASGEAVPVTREAIVEFSIHADESGRCRSVFSEYVPYPEKGQIPLEEWKRRVHVELVALFSNKIPKEGKLVVEEIKVLPAEDSQSEFIVPLNIPPKRVLKVIVQKKSFAGLFLQAPVFFNLDTQPMMTIDENAESRLLDYFKRTAGWMATTKYRPELCPIEKVVVVGVTERPGPSGDGTYDLRSPEEEGQQRESDPDLLRVNRKIFPLMSREYVDYCLKSECFFRKDPKTGEDVLPRMKKDIQIFPRNRGEAIQLCEQIYLRLLYMALGGTDFGKGRPYRGFKGDIGNLLNTLQVWCAHNTFKNDPVKLELYEKFFDEHRVINPFRGMSNTYQKSLQYVSNSFWTNYAVEYPEVIEGIYLCIRDGFEQWMDKRNEKGEQEQPKQDEDEEEPPELVQISETIQNMASSLFDDAIQSWKKRDPNIKASDFFVLVPIEKLDLDAVSNEESHEKMKPNVNADGDERFKAFLQLLVGLPERQQEKMKKYYQEYVLTGKMPNPGPDSDAEEDESSAGEVETVLDFPID